MSFLSEEILKAFEMFEFESTRIKTLVFEEIT